jgi:hypothetical protein
MFQTNLNPESQALITQKGTHALLRLFDLRTDGFNRLMAQPVELLASVQANLPGLTRPAKIDILDTDDGFFACSVRVSNEASPAVIAVGRPGTDFRHEVADWYGYRPDLIGIVGETEIDWQTPNGVSLHEEPVIRALYSCLEPREQFETHVGPTIVSALRGLTTPLDADTRVLCGPLVVWLNDPLGEIESDMVVQRTLATWTPRTYFTPGLNPEQLATYQCLRKSGLSPEEAYNTVELVAA